MGLRRKIFSAMGRLRLRAQGVRVGDVLTLYGLPRVRRAPESRIVLGANVVLCSTQAGNPLGVNHPVVLSTLAAGSEIVIGNDTGLSGAAVCAAKSVRIGANCLIGANVTITDSDFHAVLPRNRRYNTNPADIGCAPVVLEDNVWLGTNALVLKGVRIGRNSIVAAGSVVTKSLPANCIAGGNPARVLREFTEDEKRPRKFCLPHGEAF